MVDVARDLRVDFFIACAIARLRNQFARGQKTIGSHLNPGFKDRSHRNTTIAAILAITGFQMIAAVTRIARRGLHDRNARRDSNFSIPVISFATIAAIAD